MGARSFLSATMRTLKLTRKSDKDEFLLYLKLVFLGIAVVGTIGFVIYYVAAILKLTTGT